jgi:hypothetical protein
MQIMVQAVFYLFSSYFIISIMRISGSDNMLYFI